ncbi:MAG: DUF1918 domain-containing protein [Thermoplasmata archaeon]|nr:DUF1918 domain-containing protein [Thermoplasmata archaeon]
MDARVGDRIVVESEGVGVAPREGEIIEVIEGESGVHYRVRWSGGQESVYFPSAGAATIVTGTATRA